MNKEINLNVKYSKIRVPLTNKNFYTYKCLISVNGVVLYDIFSKDYEKESEFRIRISSILRNLHKIFTSCEMDVLEVWEE